jgi:hypothetical protein
LDQQILEPRNLNLANTGSVETTAVSLEHPAPAGQSAAAPQAVTKIGLRELWAGWKRVARKIGDFQARVLLTIFYFVLLAPFALIMRRTSDPLTLKPATQRGWGVKEGPAQYTVEMARKQF